MQNDVRTICKIRANCDTARKCDLERVNTCRPIASRKEYETSSIGTTAPKAAAYPVTLPVLRPPRRLRCWEKGCRPSARPRLCQSGPRLDCGNMSCCLTSAHCDDA